jgi:psp operon transcriptional activator PspF
MILIVDDQPEVRDYVAKLLAKKGHEVESAATREAALDLLRKRANELELAILDLDLGGGAESGLDLLAKFRAEAPKLPVIILSGKGTIELAVRALKAGAQEFLEKDLYIEEHLDASLEKVRRFYEIVEENRRLERENTDLRRTATFVREMQQTKYRAVGDSPGMRALLERARALASIPRPVLIRGERGSGKELVAAAIHYAGERRRKPFVAVNCAAFSGQLLESEMFGHEKGAFTGADKQKVGRFELADQGTLFLDEIGNMSLEFQEKVLRVIEYQEFERVGGTARLSVNVRVIAATNADLEALMEKGEFRRDLYDRLTFEVLRVPPLRERREDIPLLAAHFAQRFAAEVKLPQKRFSDAALRALQAYAWPGNIRELKNVVERLVFAVARDEVDAADIPPEIRAPRASAGGGAAAAAGNFTERIEALEREMLERGLADAGQNQKKAAALLGLTYDQFRHYYKKHGLKRDADAEAAAAGAEG